MRSVSTLVLLSRHARGSDVRLLFFSLLMSVAIAVAVSLLISRLQSALVNESARFLAADAVLSSGQAIESEWLQRAQGRGLDTALTTTFTTMIFNVNDESLLVSAKAVSPDYPLRGDVEVSDTPFGEIEARQTGPERGSVWIAPRIMHALALEIGDAVLVGDASLTVEKVLRREPDATNGAFALGPKLLFNHHDLDATGVLQPGSRAGFRLLLAGESEIVQTFVGASQSLLVPGQRFLTLEDNEPRIRQAMERAQLFLLLASVLALLLALAALSLAARQYALRQANTVAIWKSLGAQRDVISRHYLALLSYLVVVAVVLGSGLGFGIQASLVKFLAPTLPFDVPPASFLAGIAGVMVGPYCVAFFVWPSLRMLAGISPLSVLRSDPPSQFEIPRMRYVLGALLLLIVIAGYTGETFLLGVISIAIAFILLGGMGVVSLGVLLLRRYGVRNRSILTLGFAALARRRGENAILTAVFGLALMMMLLLTLVRTSILEQWQTQLPEQAPNHFVLNVAPEERTTLAAFFERHQVAAQPLYAMTRGRILAVNDEPLPVDDNPDQPRRQREANFTYADVLPEDNALTRGRWWARDSQIPEVSLEQGFAERIGASLGDSLQIQIGAQSITASVSSIREVNWETMKPNFFVIFPREVLEPFPAMYMTSFYLSPENKTLLQPLSRELRTVSIVELDVIFAELKGIVGHVTTTIEWVLVMIITAGFLVLMGGVVTSLDQRMRDSAILRALGASRRQLLGALWVEFAGIGLMAGGLAVVGAEVASFGLQTWVFDFSYRPTLWLWPLALVVSAVTVGAFGVMFARSVVTTSPLHVLRHH